MTDLTFKQRITETLEENFMPYAMSVIVSRAIPEIDGFKPSHRKLLYTMYKMKLLNSQKTKSANVVGQTMKLNPHGDQAIYATLVRLTRGFDALLHPYIDSKGNFGKVTSRDMKFAASRYTEVKLDALCEEIFENIEKNAVDFVDNYDGRSKEPTLLPTTFPNLLVSANKGIAVGMASNICSFNLKEICEAVVAVIKDPTVNLSNIISGPDFPTGGYLIYDENVLNEIYHSGTGSFKLRAKYRFVKEYNCIEIFEIPYTTTVEAIIEKVIDMVKGGRIKEINDIRDETDLGGLKIAIDLKRGIDPDAFMTKLYRYTPLEDSFGCNFNIIINGRPQVLGVKSIIQEWVEFRVKCIKRVLTYDLGKLNDRFHLLSGLKEVLLDIDRAIAIVKDTENDEQVVPNLMTAFVIDEIQADYVAEIKLRNLNKDYLIKQISEIKKLEETIKQIQNTLSDEKEIKKIIVKEQGRIAKKYGKERQTEILHLEKVKFHEDKHEIEDFNLKFFITEHGYLKKISLVSLRSANMHKLKDEDAILQEMDGTNLDDVLLFTDKHQVYKIKAHELDEHKASGLGEYIPNLLKLDPDETVIKVINTRSYEGFMMFIFKNGKMAKVPLKSYETKTYRKKLIKAYSDESELIAVTHILEDVDILLIRRAALDQCSILVMPTSLIPEKASKNTVGVQSIRLKKDSYLAEAYFINSESMHHFTRFIADKVPSAGTIIAPMLETDLITDVNLKRL